MKKIFLALFLALNLFFLTRNSYAGVGTNEDGTTVGAFKMTETFCQNFSKMSALLNSFQIVQWPVAGFPGIVMGVTQRTSVLHDVCDFMNQLAQLDGVNAIFFSANYLNELTGAKWDHHLKQADRTWNLANSIYDFDNGGMRPGALTSESTAREMNDWMEQTYSWHQKTFNNKEVYIKHRTERESEMQNFSRASYQRAVLQDAVNCPTPPDNTDYKKIYDKQVKNQEQKRDDAKEDLDFFKQQLYYMGPHFMNNDAEMKEYSDGLERLLRDGVTYKRDAASKRVDTSKKTKDKDSQGHVIEKKQKLSQVYYKYGTQTDSKLWNDFKKRWGERWTTWVAAKWSSSGSFGALTGAGADRVEEEFKDLSSECNPSRLSRGLNPESPRFDADRAKLIEDCKESVKMNQKKAANLFEYYVSQIQNALYNFKSSNAAIWSVESQYAGIHRLVSVKSQEDNGGANFQQETVSCSDKLSAGEMQLVEIKQQNVNNALTEQIAKESIKQSTMMETQKIEEKEENDEVNRKRVMVEERNRALTEGSRDLGEPFPIKGSGL